MDWKLILYVLGPAVVIIALLVEAYKKKIRKNQAKPWEIRILAIILTAILTYTGVKGFDLPGHDLAIVYYMIGVYALQFFVDMKVIKSLVNAWAKKKGIEDPWRSYSD